MTRPGRVMVERLYEAFNRRDAGAMTELLDPGFTWRPNPDDLEQRSRRGAEEVLDRSRELWETLDVRTEIVELIDRGDQLVAVVRHTAKVHGSEGRVDRIEAHVWAARGERLTQLAEFPDRDSALDAAG